MMKRKAKLLTILSWISKMAIPIMRIYNKQFEIVWTFLFLKIVKIELNPLVAEQPEMGCIEGFF